MYETLASVLYACKVPRRLPSRRGAMTRKKGLHTRHATVPALRVASAAAAYGVDGVNPIRLEGRGYARGTLHVPGAVRWV